MTVLGSTTSVTTISGGATFSGTYHVVGELLLENGYFNVKPGTVFYIDGYGRTSPVRRVTGLRIRLGKNATLHAEEAIFRAACNVMWSGIVLDPDEPGQVLELEESVVAHAYTGVYIPPSSELSHYEINNTGFYYNYYHLFDEGKHDGAGPNPCLLQSNLLYSEAQYMLGPFNTYVNTTPATWFYNYEAIHLNPQCPLDLQDDVVIHNNRIVNSIYGIVNNVANCGDFQMDGNTLENMRVAGYWLDDTKGSYVLGNVLLDAGRYATQQVSATAPAYGALIRLQSSQNFLLTVTGSNGQDTTSTRSQTGILIEDLAAELSENALQDLTYGISLRGTSSGTQSVNSNVITNCANGFRILPNSSLSTNFQLQCNTIAPPALSGMRGIWVQSNAFLPTKGTVSVPAGNKFVPASGGSFSHVENDGSNGSFVYYRYNSGDEAVPGISGGTSGTVSNMGITPNSTNNCNARGFSPLVGVNRGTGTLSSYVVALMDTVRRRAAPAYRLRQYAGEIAQAHLALNLTAALEAYALSLPAANAEAYNQLTLTLLRYYTYEGQNQTGAARLRNHLLSNGAANADCRAWASYLAVTSSLQHVRPQPGERLAAADSAALHQVALTATGAAEPAATLLRYYCPGVSLMPASERAMPAAVISRLHQAAAPGSIRELFPNPASRQVRVYYELGALAEGAELRLSSLLTGKVVFRQTTQAGQREAVLDLKTLPAGQYACALVVAGRPVDVQRLQVVNE
ncbi:right-handed parallel beta-helix repeat-containing protein [Hymenobacter gummosus]|nr:right-handed parallel beta-helix repeat-containing protein [Hymenobacter gummosus]